MECCLCKDEKKLIKAHIIPKWAFMYLYPKDELKRQPLIIASTGLNKRSHTGIYGSNLLCLECDSFLGKYDNYGKTIIIDSPIEPYPNVDIAYKIRNINSEMLTIFLISVLWRISIAKIKEFSNINLGPYEQEIRDLLYKIKVSSNLNYDLETYSIVFTRFGEGDYPDLVDRNIQTPFSIKIDGINFNVLYFPRGFKIYIKTDKRDSPSEFKRFSISGNELTIIKIGNFQDSDEFKFTVQALNKD